MFTLLLIGLGCISLTWLVAALNAPDRQDRRRFIDAAYPEHASLRSCPLCAAPGVRPHARFCPKCGCLMPFSTPKPLSPDRLHPKKAS